MENTSTYIISPAKFFTTNLTDSRLMQFMNSVFEQEIQTDLVFGQENN